MPNSASVLTVQTTCIDAILDNAPSVALIRLDLEGAELQALLGHQTVALQNMYPI